jgi:dethiobiotin synthetase
VNIPSLFVTGTSTGVGKTVAAAAILRVLGQMGVRAVGLKPVASGSARSGPGASLRNPDALELQAAAPVSLAYDDVNPWCFEPAVAPHIAAAEAARPVTLDNLTAWYDRVVAGAGFAVVEGAGGWRVPLHPEGFLSDLPEARGMDVVLVVGMTLGCLNHARLTAEAIEHGGRCRLAGWIANDIDPGFERRGQNRDTLVRLLGSEPLAEIPWLPATGRSDAGTSPSADLAGAARLGALLRRLAGRGDHGR